MKIQASHHDHVEWEPKPIRPGTIFNKLGRMGKSKPDSKKELVLESPCRLDIGLIDHSGVKFTDSDMYKPGEMSFCCNRFTRVKVRLTDGPEIRVDSGRPLLVRHNALLMKAATDYRDGFEITTSSELDKHSGFASTAVMADTVLFAINRLLGEPLTFRELRYIASYNYAEESDSAKDMLFPGASSGATFNTIRKGGFVMTSAECEEIFRSEIPGNMQFVVGTPRKINKGPEESDAEMKFISWMRHIERTAAATTCLWIVTEIMPYWIKGDYRKAGEAIYNYTLFGAKGLHLLLHRCGEHDVLLELKEAGLEAGWMCSVGPSLAVYTTSEALKIKAMEIFRKREWDTIVTTGNNTGIREIDDFS